jgi:ATP-dependent DNA helicase RecG
LFDDFQKEKYVEITNTRARELTGIESENSMKRIFFRLKDQGLIESVPGKRGAKSAWQKPGIQLKLPFTD